MGYYTFEAAPPPDWSQIQDGAARWVVNDNLLHGTAESHGCQSKLLTPEPSAPASRIDAEVFDLDGDAGLVIRSNPSGYYVATWNRFEGGSSLWRRVGSEYSLLATKSLLLPTRNALLSLLAIGPDISFVIQAESKEYAPVVLTAVDATHAEGKAGVRVNENHVSFKSVTVNIL